MLLGKSESETEKLLREKTNLEGNATYTHIGEIVSKSLPKLTQGLVNEIFIKPRNESNDLH